MSSIVDNARAALAIAWRRGRGEFPPEDGDELARIEREVNKHAELVREVKLVDGVCPICRTPVLVDSVDKDGRKLSLRFIPHDDPAWCRAAAALHVKAIERALDQAREDVAVMHEREAFYRHAYRITLKELEYNVGLKEPPLRSYDEWRQHVEMQVNLERVRDSERQAIGIAQYIRANQRPVGGG